MPYRKTEKVKARLAAVRESIITAAIGIIAQRGMDAMNSENVAKRARIAVGTVFNHFPDMVELRAAIVAEVLSRDLAAIQGQSLPDAVDILYSRAHAGGRLSRAVLDCQGYRDALRHALEARGCARQQAGALIGAIRELVGIYERPVGKDALRAILGEYAMT